MESHKWVVVPHDDSGLYPEEKIQDTALRAVEDILHLVEETARSLIPTELEFVELDYTIEGSGQADLQVSVDRANCADSEHKVTTFFFERQFSFELLYKEKVIE